DLALYALRSAGEGLAGEGPVPGLYWSGRLAGRLLLDSLEKAAPQHHALVQGVHLLPVLIAELVPEAVVVTEPGGVAHVHGLAEHGHPAEVGVLGGCSLLLWSLTKQAGRLVYVDIELVPLVVVPEVTATEGDVHQVGH